MYFFNSGEWPHVSCRVAGSAWCRFSWTWAPVWRCWESWVTLLFLTWFTPCMLAFLPYTSPYTRFLRTAIWIRNASVVLFAWLSRKFRLGNGLDSWAQPSGHCPSSGFFYLFIYLFNYLFILFTLFYFILFIYLFYLFYFFLGGGTYEQHCH